MSDAQMTSRSLKLTEETLYFSLPLALTLRFPSAF